MKCENCNIIFYKKENKRFCSWACRSVGYMHSVETKRKIANARTEKYSFENGPAWKGDKVGYRALHLWVEKIKGIPTICSHCNQEKPGGKRRRIQWANVSGKYLRNIDDWIALCIPCHKVFDA